MIHLESFKILFIFHSFLDYYYYQYIFSNNFSQIQLMKKQPQSSAFSNTNDPEDILKKKQIFAIFENELQAELFNERCHDTGEKVEDEEKAKMFKQEISKINSKKQPNVLNLFSMRLGVNSIVKLATLLKNLNYQTLNLADNAISQYGIHAVKNLINTTKIIHLNLASNMISQVGLSIILDDLIKNHYLKSLDLGILQGSIRKNSLGIDGARCLASLLIQTKSLQTLKLQDNDIGIAGAEILSIALKQTKVLKHFKLSQNLIKTQGAEAILKNSINLITLDLGKNFIKSSIGNFVKNYLETNNNLKKFNLQFNELMPQGIKILCKGLTKSKLTSLNIRGNSIRDKGLQYLREVYDQKQCLCRQTLQQLDISINQITEEGMKHLTEFLMKSKIKSLNISKNLLGDDGLIQLAESMFTQLAKPILNKIDISSCKISDRGMIEFLESIQDLTSLQHIKCSDNYISDKNQKYMLEILNKNLNLISLQLNGNRLSLTCVKAIKKLMNRNLKQLEEREPNKIKSEIYLLKEKQRKILQTKQKLQLQSRQINTLQQTKSRLLQNIARLQRDQIAKKANFQSIILRKRQEIEAKNIALKTKIQDLEQEKRTKQNILSELTSQLRNISEKRSDLQYQIRITKDEGGLIQKEFAIKTEALKQQK